MIAYDLQSDDNGDLVISNGDFVSAPSDQQHIEDIIQSFPGWWKESPQVGVGIFAFINSAGKQQQIEKSVRLQLSADGYLVNNPRVEQDTSGKMIIHPNAVRV